jgi:hypothetical protein
MLMSSTSNESMKSRYQRLCNEYETNENHSEVNNYFQKRIQLDPRDSTLMKEYARYSGRTGNATQAEWCL